MGVGIGVRVPGLWMHHCWRGCGTPIEALARQLQRDIARGTNLPSSATLESWPDLEASALSAMDALAPRRLAIILHADDPLLLASSRGAAQAQGPESPSSAMSLLLLMFASPSSGFHKEGERGVAPARRW